MRLQVGRGDELWADESQAAASECRPLRQNVAEKMEAAQSEVRVYFIAEAARLRELGDEISEPCSSTAAPRA